MTDDPDFYPVRTDWSQSTSKLNISAFVYRDRNRNGRYDGDDRPMAGVAVAVTGDGTATIAERSNTSGWANFAMSTSDSEAAIREPGERQFTVLVPSRWIATSGNADQAASFRPAPGSPSGLTLERSLGNVGLAPELAVSGRLASSANIIVQCEDEISEAASNLPGHGFRIPVKAGAVSVTIGDISRSTLVSELPVDLGLLDHAREISDASAIEVIDFDRVTGMDLCKIPNGYRELEFANLTTVKAAYYQGEGYVNGAVSGTYVAYNSSGLPAEIASPSRFDFISCALSVAWLAAEGETVTVEAWRGDRLVARDDVVLSALGAVRYEPRLAGVTRLRFTTAHHWQFVLSGLEIAR